MTRRDLLTAAAVGLAGLPQNQQPLVVSLHRVTNRRAQCSPDQFHRFWWKIWPEAVRDFGRGGIRFQCSDEIGEVRRSPGDRPIFIGLKRGAVNLVLTDHLPMYWDNGRALAGATSMHEGYCVCVIALLYAHGHRVPYLSTNTCVHELLHALLGDIFVDRPTWLQAGSRESRIDWYATRLWLFGEGSEIRKSAETVVKRLETNATRADGL